MAGEIPLIAKIIPKNDAFVDIVDATNAGVDTSSFIGILSSADDTVQKALETLDGAGVPAHDYTEPGYKGDELTTCVYKQGGPSGTVVATFTLAYDGSDNLVTIVHHLGGISGPIIATFTLAYDGSDNLISVTKS